MASSPAATQIVALLDQADDRARAGNAKAAVQFYNAALSSARAAGAPDPAIAARLQAGAQFIQRHVAAFRALLAEAAEAGADASAEERRRIQHMVEMMDGRREIFVQQPSVLFSPYLAHRQFWDPAEFDWAADIVAATPAIRAELEALIADDAQFAPYIQDDPDRPARDFHGLNNDRRWSALYLYEDGKVVEENARRCPRTMDALAKVPLSDIGHRTPVVLFSRLEPGARIPPHSGMLNCRLICHLPLIVPPGCTLRVGNETREWREGELMIFDDSIEHEAHNPTGALRVILLFDVWKPEIGPAERAAISRIFDAIDTYQGLPDA